MPLLAQDQWTGLVNVPVGPTGFGLTLGSIAGANINQVKALPHASGNVWEHRIPSDWLNNQHLFVNGNFLDELTFRSEQIATGSGAIADHGSINRDAAFSTNGHTVESGLDSSLSREIQHKAVVEIAGAQAVESDIGDKEAFSNRSTPSRAGNFGLISYQVEHAGEGFEAQVPLVA